MRDNRIIHKTIFSHSIKERRFYHEGRIKTTRKESRKRLEELKLACELTKLIHHFFPDLLLLLKKLPDHRNQSYITYPAVVLLMTRILSSIFYISSMRKTSEEFNSDTAIENLWTLCGEKTPAVEELPYWETVNRYLKGLDFGQLQKIVCQLCRRLLRSRSFEGNRIRGKYWQVLIDGTQIHSSRGELDGKCLYRVRKRGTKEEYRENYYYVLEAKLVLHPKVVVSIMTEFVENPEGKESEKQDCERKACWRLMERLKEEFPRLGICLCGDSLYACERFFEEGEGKKWKYIVRFKERSIPYVADEYQSLKKQGKNLRKKRVGNREIRHDYIEGIAYKGYEVNVVEYAEELETEYRKGKKKGKKRGTKKEFLFLTNLTVSQRNVEAVAEQGRMRWKIENEGFNTQKRQGYNLEHPYSKDYQAQKCHYYLIQIGHMIAQLMEAWGKIWEKIGQSREQKHRRVLESFKTVRIKQESRETEQKFQIRLS